MPQTALKDALDRTGTPPAVLVLWAHQLPDPRTIYDITTPATRLLLTGPGWPTAAVQARSLAGAIDLLTGHLRETGATLDLPPQPR
jgi:hypothetical protein